MFDSWTRILVGAIFQVWNFLNEVWFCHNSEVFVQYPQRGNCILKSLVVAEVHMFWYGFSWWPKANLLSLQNYIMPTGHEKELDKAFKLILGLFSSLVPILLRIGINTNDRGGLTHRGCYILP